MIEGDGFTQRWAGRDQRVPWTDVTLARLEVREVRRRHERFDQHVLHVEFPGGVVMIDVSRRRPDFRASAHLAKEFEEHLELQRT